MIPSSAINHRSDITWTHTWSRAVAIKVFTSVQTGQKVNTIENNVVWTHVIRMELAYTAMTTWVSTMLMLSWDRNMEMELLGMEIEVDQADLNQNLHFAITKYNPKNIRLFSCITHWPNIPCQALCGQFPSDFWGDTHEDQRSNSPDTIERKVNEKIQKCKFNQEHTWWAPPFQRRR